ncbi:MAG: NAD(P)/FAD-dependent oxidoreductase, partial [Leptospiraceae bacterium]|nr:NAD(P)/FAD-dependent oxidoreductase [Leptospiraceae bacterium]
NLRKFLPASVVYSMARTRNILLQKSLYALAKAQPGIVRNLILNAVKSQLGDEVDISHFTPKYNPWDERLCVVPEGDLFKTLKSGKASIVTDTIDTFTETGIQLKSGKFLEADIIVTATGLDLQLLGGIQVKVDNREMNLPDRLTYKAVLLEDVPNMALIFGYTNASWTLKVDIACEYLCRLVKYMDEHGYRTVKTRPAAAFKTEETVMGGLSSGYIQRAVDQLPKQGSEGVWKVTNDYLSDLATLKFGSIADDQLIFQ